jgi:hypothetical protein
VSSALAATSTVAPVGRDSDHAGVVAEPLDLTAACRTLLVQPVRGHQLVPEQERRLRPYEDVADPAPVATAPSRAKTVHLSVGDSDDALKSAGLVLDPTLAREHERGKRDQDDEIDAEHREQRDHHGSRLSLGGLSF